MIIFYRLLAYLTDVTHRTIRIRRSVRADKGLPTYDIGGDLKPLLNPYCCLGTPSTSLGMGHGVPPTQCPSWCLGFPNRLRPHVGAL